ncbi:MAG TPA: CPBP family intramembrane metalloprotease [Deltaproteobacteria bacterium]|nr:CPBP family intramembrane metalloprotease [Deltaproteobacteria bacterium]
MLNAARDLWQWTVEHRWLLFLTTVAAFGHLHYDQHGPPAKLLILPSLAVIIFLVVPWAAALIHDVRDKQAVSVAILGGLIALAPAMFWAHGNTLIAVSPEGMWGSGPSARRILADDPMPLVVGALVGLGLILLASWKGKLDLHAWGLGLGDVRWWSRPVFILLALIAIGIPLTAWLFPEFVSYYPRYVPARVRPDVVALLQYQLAMGIYMFCWEFFFRGFMLFGLMRYMGPAPAILMQAYPFFLLHDAKPEPELISSWFGGIGVGWLAWRSRSCWPSFLLHWIMYMTMELSAFVLRHGYL